MANKKVQTKCVYCGSTSVGKGCPISSHRTHVHLGDPTSCIYCKSKSIGAGCPYNPHGRNHVRGIEFNQMVNDSVGTGIIGGYVLDKLKTPITEMDAFKLGLINETGKIVKEPVTTEERHALGIVERYVLNLKSLAGSKLAMSDSLTRLQLEESVSMADYEKLSTESINLRENISNLVGQFKSLVADAYLTGMSSAAIEKVLVDEFQK